MGECACLAACDSTGSSSGQLKAEWTFNHYKVKGPVKFESEDRVGHEGHEEGRK